MAYFLAPHHPQQHRLSQSPTPPVAASRFRRRKAAGETISHSQPERAARTKTARNKPRRQPTATSRQHAKAPPATASASSVPAAAGTAGDTENEPAVGESSSPSSQKKRQLRESASAPLSIPTAATSDGAAAAAAASTALQGKPPAGGHEEAGQVNSPLARQRLEKAKALDEEVATGQGGDGGG